MAKDRQLHTAERRRVLHHVRTLEPDCWLCGHPINVHLPTLSPLASTIDEIIPRSKGGSAVDLGNVHHAHRCCNSTRGTTWPITADVITRCQAAWARHQPTRTTSRRW